MKHRLPGIFCCLIAWTLIACGGAAGRGKSAEPPPPIDENLLDLVPFETDLVVWVDLAKLRAAPVWGLFDKVLEGDTLKLPEEDTVNPMLQCDEAVLAFMDSEQFGNQLLIITKGAPETQAQAIAAARAKEGAVPQNAEGFEGIRTEQTLMLSLTPNTIIVGNESIVRMGAKSGLKKGRSILENPAFATFETGGDATARMHYHAGLNTKNVQQFKSVVPKVNPDAISTIDGTLHTESGTHIAANIEMESQMDASVLTQEITRTLDSLKGNMFVLFLGLDWLRDKINIVSDKNRVSVDVRLQAADINNLNQLADRLKKIQELLGNSEGAPE